MMSRLRVGVIGCGGIAQIQHLPHLVELSSNFEIAGLCDLSRELLAHVGAAYGVPPERQHVDYHELVERADIDAVIVCNSGTHAPPAIAATALEHGLTVVTRNVRHFEPAGVKVLNPFVGSGESADG